MRRRRVVAVAVVAGLGVAASASALVIRGAADDGAQAQTAPGGSLSFSNPSPPKRSPSSAARGRLGSGNAVRLAFGGDVHFESPIRERLASAPASVLAPIAPVLRRAHLAMLNLETAVTERGTPASKAYVFRAPTSAVNALSAGGIDVVSAANNHGMDLGEAGLRDTLAAAKRAGMRLVPAAL